MSFRQSIGIPPIVALHRYWMHANVMRIHFEEELKKKTPNTAEKTQPKYYWQRHCTQRTNRGYSCRTGTDRFTWS
jgi:hypothetical protein